MNWSSCGRLSRPPLPAEAKSLIRNDAVENEDHTVAAATVVAGASPDTGPRWRLTEWCAVTKTVSVARAPMTAGEGACAPPELQPSYCVGPADSKGALA